MNSIEISKSVSTAVRPSPRVLETASMFGLGVDDSRKIAIVPPCRIPLPHLSGKSGIVFITGPSGSGKSTILRLIGERLAEGEAEAGPRPIDAASDEVTPLVLRFDELPALAEFPLVDALGNGTLSLARVLAVLSIVGLGEAFVMIRRPRELSDGQRYRLRLAQVFAALMQDERDGGEVIRPAIVLADEFGSTLDRVTAHTICRNIRRWMDRQDSRPISFIVATAHDDLLEPLQPEVLVWKGLGEQVEVLTR